MIYELNIKPEADGIFRKLSKKNSKQLSTIHKKIEEIRSNPWHEHKFLRRPLQTFNRVYIDNHFVLIFRIEHRRKIVNVYYYDHHDNVYKWRPKNDN